MILSMDRSYWRIVVVFDFFKRVIQRRYDLLFIINFCNGALVQANRNNKKIRLNFWSNKLS